MKQESHCTTLETKCTTRFSTVSSEFGSGEPAADLVQEADLRVAGPADQRFLVSHVLMFLLRGIRASLRAEQCLALLRHFLDEKSHLGVRRLDVDRQAVAPQFLGRHRSD